MGAYIRLFANSVACMKGGRRRHRAGRPPPANAEAARAAAAGRSPKRRQGERATVTTVDSSAWKDGHVIPYRGGFIVPTRVLVMSTVKPKGSIPQMQRY